jgi:diketogulonate reductase-like aldo/keto reductase
VLADSVITERAAEHGISVDQIVLAWAVATPGSAVVFPSSSPDELFDHWESRRVELGPEEILAINALDQASA